MVIIGLVFGFILFVPDRMLHRIRVTEPRPAGKLLIAISAIVTVLITILPMTLSPYWNGTIPEHRDQYERMADALLEGKLYLDYQDIDPKLAAMENPYDPDAREKAGVDFHWDHAWYNGRYYMYFGIVPVLLVFLPFRIITGHALAAVYATQLFTGIGIIGLFVLFRKIAQRFFPKMTLGTYLVLSLGVSFLSFWYASGAPALYCTAICSAICMEVWSLFFFFKAVYEEPKEKCQILYATLGALFGALAFGCRPPVALANLLVIPLLVAYLGRKKTAGELNPKLAGKLLLAALPYLLVGAGLMIYNYARFDNPLEFGQTYQLTNTNLKNYGSFLNLLHPIRTLNRLIVNFFTPSQFQSVFPWVSYSSAYWNFPLLLLGAAIWLPKTLRAARKERLAAVLIVLFLLPFIITIVEIFWSPTLVERYRMDIYFLMGIAVFFSVGFIGERLETKHDASIFRKLVSILALAAMVSALLLWLVPNDANYSQSVEGVLDSAARLLFFIKR